MKPVKPLSRAVAVRQLARKSLEDYARGVLDPEVVLSEATKAAALGYFCVTISFDRALDMRDTEAALALVETLKREGYALEWRDRLVFATDTANKTTSGTFDLLVRW
jgi:hypothetical protein